MAIPVSRLIIDWRFGNFQNKPQKTFSLPSNKVNKVNT
jgi:hypothetical protein